MDPISSLMVTEQPPAFIEDWFSTTLYTGTGASLDVTTGINLSAGDGMIWIKNRSSTASHTIFDTARGTVKYIKSDSTSSQVTSGTSLTSYNNDGFTVGTDSIVNTSGDEYVAYSFRKKRRFFDIVTWSGQESSPGTARAIGHNLGVVPGCIIIKAYTTTNAWYIYHKSLTTPAEDYMDFTTAAEGTSSDAWENTAPTASQFTVGFASDVTGVAFVAYLFADDPTGLSSDGLISCGSYTGNGSQSGPSISLGWEPQFILMKSNTVAGSGWYMLDSDRTIEVGESSSSSTGTDKYISPHSTAGETDAIFYDLNYDGFKVRTVNGDINTSSQNYTYVAIRRPMKVPEIATDVFAVNNTAASTAHTVGFVPDAALFRGYTATTNNNFTSRLQGQALLLTDTTGTESAGTSIGWDDDTGTWSQGSAGGTLINYLFKRATGFMDIVCYTGTGVAHAEGHKLGVAPEMMLVKCRTAANDWAVYLNDETDYLLLNSTAATADDATYWNDVAPTSTQFTVGKNSDVNTSTATYIAYLFATLAGISKVGTYTGNGTNKTIDCGFSGGARFVLIKRTDSTGDWFLWDTVRGIVAGNDSHISLNTTVAEVTTDDSIDPDSSGFIVNEVAATNINVSAATYVYLAIA